MRWPVVVVSAWEPMCSMTDALMGAQQKHDEQDQHGDQQNHGGDGEGLGAALRGFDAREAALEGLRGLFRRERVGAGGGEVFFEIGYRFGDAGKLLLEVGELRLQGCGLSGLRRLLGRQRSQIGMQTVAQVDHGGPLRVQGCAVVCLQVLKGLTGGFVAGALVLEVAICQGQQACDVRGEFDELCEGFRPHGAIVCAGDAEGFAPEAYDNGAIAVRLWRCRRMSVAMVATRMALMRACDQTQ